MKKSDDHWDLGLFGGVGDTVCFTNPPSALGASRRLLLDPDPRTKLPSALWSLYERSLRSVRISYLEANKKATTM